MKLKGSLELSEFTIFRAVRRAYIKFTTLDFKRADFDLFSNLLGRVPWDKAL